DRGKVRHIHPGPDPGTARDVRNPGTGPLRQGPQPGGRLRRAQAREGAEGRVAERTGDVRRRRDGLDSPGHGHLYDGTLERSSPRSRDLRVDVDLDTDGAIRGESPLQRRARPGMGYGDPHE